MMMKITTDINISKLSLVFMERKMNNVDMAMHYL